MRAALATGLMALVGCGRIGFGGAGDGDDGDGPTPPSCTDLAPACGPTGESSCCDRPHVDGGTYYRTFDLGTDGQFGGMDAPATVSAFRLDRHEVTVGRFRRFVAAGHGTQQQPPAPGAGAHPGLPTSGWEASWTAKLPADTAALVASLHCQQQKMWTDTPADHENRPINCISFYEAMAFCIWDGGFLPTEAEWNYVAAAGGEQRAYPWSRPASSLAIEPEHASYYVDPTKQCYGDMQPGCTAADLIPVGSRPAGDGAWGHADLAGNVLEWTLDVYAIYPVPCNDCANLTPGVTDRVIRGGSYTDEASFLRSGYRVNYVPYERHSFVGVRCARPP